MDMGYDAEKVVWAWVCFKCVADVCVAKEHEECGRGCGRGQRVVWLNSLPACYE